MLYYTIVKLILKIVLIFKEVFKLLVRKFLKLFFSLLGLDKIEFLQSHENREIYQKAFDIIERYFGTEEEDKALAPQMDQASQQYQFSGDTSTPMGGFKF